jgi:hypothetical protein
VTAELVECDASRKYPIDASHKLARSCEASERQRQIPAMPMPAVRKVSPARAGRLSELIATCAIASEGSRSESDFSICCYAIRHGIAPDVVWPLIKSVGKFAEQGRRYFDLTWESASYDVQASLCDRPQKRSQRDAKSEATTTVESPSEESDERPTISIDARTMPVSTTIGQISEQLLATGSYFNRVEQLVVVRDQYITPIPSLVELTGLLNRNLENRSSHKS